MATVSKKARANHGARAKPPKVIRSTPKQQQPKVIPPRVGVTDVRIPHKRAPVMLPPQVRKPTALSVLQKNQKEQDKEETDASDSTWEDEQDAVLERQQSIINRTYGKDSINYIPSYSETIKACAPTFEDAQQRLYYVVNEKNFPEFYKLCVIFNEITTHTAVLIVLLPISITRSGHKPQNDPYEQQWPACVGDRLTLYTTSLKGPADISSSSLTSTIVTTKSTPAVYEFHVLQTAFPNHKATGYVVVKLIRSVIPSVSASAAATASKPVMTKTVDSSSSSNQKTNT